jgi:hypothetical protein
MKLGKFKKVALREIWKHEALDFTNWLALDENLELLSEVLETSLVNPQTEVGVGKFAVDILAEDENGHKVIIENQLETTNHDHLGKIVTYASGLQAETVVWIVKNSRDEHEQAINWLNENTNEKVNFFLIEIEAWMIDNSAPAPRFNIVAKPNDWAKTIKQSGAANKITDTKLKQQEFWIKFNEYSEDNSITIKSWRKPRPQHWYDISIGSSQAHLSAQVNTKTMEVSMNLYIVNNKELYYKIEKDKDEIENKIGSKLRWWELPDKKASMVSLVIDGDFKDPEQEDKLITWLLNQAEVFAKVFKKYL